MSLAMFGGKDLIDAAADFEASQDDNVQDFTDEENINWDDIPDSEKLSSEDIDAFDARETGMWDGAMDIIDKKVTKAVKSGDIEKVIAARKALGVTDKEVEAFRNA